MNVNRMIAANMCIYYYKHIFSSTSRLPQLVDFLVDKLFKISTILVGCLDRIFKFLVQKFQNMFDFIEKLVKMQINQEFFLISSPIIFQGINLVKFQN